MISFASFPGSACFIKHQSSNIISLWKGDRPLNVFSFLYVEDEFHFYSVESLPRVCNDVHTVCIRSRSSGALMVEVWICTTMALQNLQQYGCQTGNKLKEKSRDLNRNSSRNKNETMFGSGYENCPEFGVLGGVIFKLDIL